MMILEKRVDGWWIIHHDPELGPYQTRAEAEDDMRGLVRFYREVTP